MLVETIKNPLLDTGLFMLLANFCITFNMEADYNPICTNLHKYIYIMF